MDCFLGIELHAVVGGGVSCSDEYVRLADEGAHVHFNLNALAMRDLMDAADLAISGGGQTLYELACRGLPAVVVNLIDNQTEDIRGFSSRGFAVLACRWDAADLLDRVESGVREIWHGARREAVSAIGRSLVDGQGAFRLVAEVEQAFYGGK
jgi:spore coat polysaccharide biosynthesis predicted glycosyltransferase SpsG